ncbi:MAG: bis(5'-nucleosyl)-tetraphosphatase (symmetrical) YqeK [Lachnospiraceae bacterium]|nr:bis(5'-nucleosyl)-tetraphosphatase (symmetrical) YqeK [Lachnospiraceae bacterium]
METTQQVIVLENKMRTFLDGRRFRHTQSVMYTAASLAFVWGVDHRKAMIAGVLHDCAKCIDINEQFKICEENGYELTDYDNANPQLLHAKVGAIIAKTQLDIKDQDILNAIEFHTTGRPEMSNLEKIIYIADYMEPLRQDQPALSNIRKLAYLNLDVCLYEITGKVLKYLELKNRIPDPKTMETHLWVKERLYGK